MSETIVKNTLVKADVDTLYHLWSNFENFPTFMKDIKSVRKVSEKISHWVVEGPLGTDVEWIAEMTRSDENKRIAWNTKGTQGDVTTSGQVTFNPLTDTQTEVSVTFHYEPQGGIAAQVAARLLSDPAGMIEEALRNFKTYAESLPARMPMA